MADSAAARAAESLRPASRPALPSAAGASCCDLRLEPVAVADELPQHLADRIEGRVLEKGAGAGLDPGVRRARDLLVEALHQARLADARFADDQRDLPLTVEDALPATQSASAVRPRARRTGVSPPAAVAAWKRPRTPLGRTTR